MVYVRASGRETKEKTDALQTFWLWRIGEKGVEISMP